MATIASLLLAVVAPAPKLQAQTPSPAPAGPGLIGHGGPIRAMAVLADGQTLVTAGFDSAIIVWDVARSAARRVLRFHDGTVNALAALAGDCFASGGEDGRIAVWCGEGRAPARVLAHHQGPVSALTLAPDGRRLASGSWDATLRLWPLDPKARQEGPVTIEGHAGPVSALAFLPDGSALASVGHDGQVRLAATGDSRATPLALRHPVPLNAIVPTNDGRLIVAGADGRVRVLGLDLTTQAELNLDQGPLTTLALSSDGRLLAVAGMRTPVTLIDLAPLRVKTQILGPGLPVWALAFMGDSRSGALFTGGADRAIRRWDAATGRLSDSQMPATAASATSNDKDAERGAQVFRACRACHGLTADDTNRAGPTLHGLFGRRIGTAPDYAFSPALTQLDIIWTPETVSKLFEVGPTLYTPGTKMPEQRLTDPEDRKALVDWLARVTDPVAKP